jgi:iron complex outermembrane recepter protein
MVTWPPVSVDTSLVSKDIQHPVSQSGRRHVKPRGWLAVVVAGSIITTANAVATDSPVSQSDSVTSDSTVAATSFSTDASTGALAEVTVTARRRTELAQDVPISMTVVKGSELQDLATNSPLDELQFQAPSVSAFTLNPRNAQLAIRGIGNNPANDGLSRSVGIYLDGVYLDTAGMATTGLKDIDQVEVLRGPQGTLYGKNTTAGALNITTNAPTFTPSVTAGLTAGSYGTVGAEAALSGPIAGDVLAARLSAYDDSHSGFISSPNGGPYDDLDTQGGRLQFLFQPSADVSLRYIGDFSREDDHSGYQLLYSRGSPTAPIPFSKWSATPGITALVDPSDPWTTNANEPQAMRSDNWGNTLELNWSTPGGYTLTNIAAARSFEFAPVNNSGLTVYAPLANAPLYSSNADVRDHQASEEVRLSAPVGGVVDYVAGLFYFWKHLDGDQRNSYGNLYSAVTGSKNAPYNNALLSYDSLFDVNSAAVFAQANWHISPKLTLTTGVRETYESDDENFTRFGLTGGTGTPPSSTIPYESSGSINNWSTGGLVSLSYKLTNDVLAYVSAAHGTKAGGFVGATPPTQTGTHFAPFSTLELEPESSNDAEIGIKASWLRNALIFNADAFYTHVHNYQVAATVTSLTGITAAGVDVNAVISKGFEAQLSAQPIQGFNLTLAGAYDEATYGSFSNAPSVQGSPAAFQNLTGAPVDGAPRWTESVTAEYSHTVAPGAVAYASASYAYRSGQYGYIDDSRYSWIGAYGLADFTLGVNVSKHYDVSLWIRNAFNVANFEVVGPLPSNLGGYYASAGQPRVFGGTVRASF